MILDIILSKDMPQVLVDEFQTHSWWQNMRRTLVEMLGLKITSYAELCIPEVRFLPRSENNPSSSPFCCVVNLTGLSMQDGANKIDTLHIEQARKEMEKWFQKLITELMPQGWRTCDWIELRVTFHPDIGAAIQGPTITFQGTAKRKNED